MSQKAKDQYEPISDEEVRNVAEGIFRRAVFCSRHVRPGDESHVMTIFMPLIAIDKETIDRMKRHNLSFFWANMSDAMPTAINGYPCFGSMHMCSNADGERIIDVVRKMEEAVGNVGTPEKKEERKDGSWTAR